MGRVGEGKGWNDVDMVLLYEALKKLNKRDFVFMTRDEKFQGDIYNQTQIEM